MNTSKPTSDIVDELVLAEASAWLARQGSGRAEDEAAFKEWLAASPVHRRAFERVNDVWELIPGALALAPERQPKVAALRRAPRWMSRVLVPAFAALVLVAACFAWTFMPAGRGYRHVYQTAVGGRRTVVLADNTRITLNTDTRLIVDYTSNRRQVWLQHGEALLHVTHEPSRPFVLRTGDSRITDLGTVFDVSHYARSVVVTLLEGKVSVGKRAQARIPPTVLQPGEQLTVQADGVQVINHPDIKDITAWKQGQLDFDDVSLAQAVAEINRYNGTQVQLDSPQLDSLRVSGVFAAEHPLQFAAAVASLHNLHVAHAHGAIVLER